MRKTVAAVILFLIFLVSYDAHSFELVLNSEAAILMNAETGAILYEKNIHEKYYPASITKIATASYIVKIRGNKLDTLVAAENDCVASISPEAKARSNYTLPPHWLEHRSTHIGIKTGEVLSLLDLLYGTMLASGNDSANVLAHFIGGTIPNFMQDLNAYLKEIGCQNTRFCNPHGLHHPKHVTTAYDMATMTKEALKDPLFRDIVSTVKHIRPKTNKQEASVLVQTNQLLRKGEHHYPYALGVKTGYTSHAMYTLVAAARHNNRTLIAVLLKCKDRASTYKDAKALFAAAFNEKEVIKRIFSKGIQKFRGKVPNTKIAVVPYIKEDVVVKYFPSEKSDLKCHVNWEISELPIKKHGRIGSLTLADNTGKTVKIIPLFASEDVSKGWASRLVELPGYLKALIIFAVVTFLFMFAFLRRNV